MPARLQHHPLLRIQQGRLDRRYAEERVVELVDIVNESPEATAFAAHRFVGK
ncbi:MAG: hypothetical protein OXF94_10265 [Gammaproteobacteria bacterium]|nr:hypothetical protein [Gammaproteobacteria bacterium]